MKIWYDACTGKHIRYGAAIAKSLRQLGHTFILTTRRHPDTLTLAEILGEEFLPVGRYSPKSLLTRTRESAARQLFFCKLFRKESPDLAISHGSVDQCRVAFGLQIPTILTFDAPHADAVNRLTIPLADYVIFSKAIPKRTIVGYNAKCRMISFDGVDEAAWIKDLTPATDYDREEPLIVIRQFEEKAVYAQERLDLLHLARRLTRLGRVIFLSRYQRKNVKGLIVPKTFDAWTKVTSFGFFFNCFLYTSKSRVKSSLTGINSSLISILSLSNCQGTILL